MIIRSIYQRVITVITLALILAACNSPGPTETINWCYRFDFTSDLNYGLTFSDGFRSSGNGLRSSDGVLGVTYQHGATVSPDYAQASVSIEVPGARNVSAYVDVFGLREPLNEQVSSNTATVIAAETNQGELNLGTQTMSLAASTASDSTITIHTLEVIGYRGSNPFGNDNCADNENPNTPTPATPSPTPTGSATATPTATATITPTPTATFTPTPTPESEWCYHFDFDAGQQGWQPFANENGDFAQWNSAGYWTRSSFADHDAMIGIDLILSDPIDVVRVRFDWIGIMSGEVNDAAIVIQSDAGTRRIQTSVNDRSYYQFNTSYFDATDYNDVNVRGNTAYIQVSHREHAFSRSDGLVNDHPIDSVTINGLGYNPFGATNCPLSDQPTPTPTSTATITSTSTSTTTATATGTATATTTPDSTPDDIGTATPVTPRYTNTPQATFTPLPTRTLFPTPIIVSTLTATVDPMVTPTATPDGDVPPGDGDDDWSNTGTCENPDGDQPNGGDSGNWIEWLFGGVSNIINCQVLPRLDFISDLANLALAAIGSIYDASIGLILYVKALGEFLVKDLMWFFLGHAFNAVNEIIYYLQLAFGNALSAVIQAFNLLVDLVSSVYDFFTSVIDFIFAAFSWAGRIQAAWSNADAITPPGLPDCDANPMDSNICAVWYILENTFFSGIGAFIMPAITLFLTLLVGFDVLDSVIERIQNLWRVTD